MNILLAWYALVFGMLAIGVYRVTPKRTKPASKHRAMPAWLSNVVAYSEPIEGYQDPIFSANDSQPMELTDAPRSKAVH